MSGDNESGEKTHDPTPKKLADARKKGDIAKSNDLTIAMIYFGFLLAILVAGAASISGAATNLTVFYLRRTCCWMTSSGQVGLSYPPRSYCRFSPP